MTRLTDEQRADLALSCLRRLVAEAKAQSHPDWRDMEALLHALQTGGDHPVLLDWEARQNKPIR